MTLVLIILAAIAIWVAWWWFVARNTPAFPPLNIDATDPLMLDAVQQAKRTVPRLRALFANAKDQTRVKIPFISNAGETEHLWAELLSLEETEMVVRYLTPPVSHTGKLERVHRHSINDLEDWVVTKDPGKYIGGYTMRVMFQRAREMGADLPRRLRAEESKYRP